MVDWAKLKVVDLKAELKRRGLPQGGLKVELVARLEEADQEATEAEPEPEPEPEPESHADEQMNDETPQFESESLHPVNGDSTSQTQDVQGVQEQTKDGQVVTQDAREIEPEQTPPRHLPATTQEPTHAAVPEVVVSTPAHQEESQPEPSPPSRDPRPADGDAPFMGEQLVQDSTVEAPAEALKRKRRSASPTPKEEEVSRKRARADAALASRSHQLNHFPPEAHDAPEVDYDRHVEPSVHPATSALCINNLMRPLRPADLRAHIVTLATAPGTSPADKIVTKFYLDFIRTHAFVALDSVSAASRVRQLLHGRVWPNESNRKALSIDFIPPEKMDSWIDMEESGGRRPSHRWEVVYAPASDGSTVEASLVSNSLSSSNNRAPPPPPPPTKPSSIAAPAPDSINSAPLGPRGAFTDSAPPTGPRGSRRPQPPPAPYRPTGEARFTRARPSVAYHLVPEHLARRRVENMRAFYTRELNRDLGREFNRYSFEDSDSFVDRGREIFEGIRPPHRERGGRGGGRGRGSTRARGGGGFRARSDRYMPGPGGWDDDDRRRF
ncbi:SAP domain-containing protein [Metarhizium album ARSEF 1941]|uniref:SAP domain-containing protein n=1 Tax=Metarhizium album (strain ARSEF 1941) TaxID=1081103 RepID=A0A0B2WX53_METAS|nr:SAP domain-containing protein [Metarhizium album ARSEF 1941]KHN98012.1 SAP domain-containing protein [Metarhizium album ARSEF 1941]